MKQSRIEQTDSFHPDGTEPENDFGSCEVLRESNRLGTGIVALVLGALSVWMLWIVQNFLEGGGWLGLIVRIILHELIFAVGFFALMLLIWAAFTPGAGHEDVTR